MLTVTQQLRTSPSPSAVVTVSGIVVADGTTVTVRRAWAGRLDPVRGATDVPVTGSTMSFIDYEMPYPVAVSYQAVATPNGPYNPDQGSSGQGGIGETRPWISDPLNPAAACAVQLDGAAVSSLSYVRSGDVMQPIGARLPVGIVGTRMVMSSVPLSILCDSLQQRDAVLDVLLSADPVCLRVSSADSRFSPLPALCYVTTQQISQVPLDVEIGGAYTRIDWVVDQVRPPSGMVVVPVRTYDDVLGEAASYSGLTTLYADYRALQLGG